MEGADVDKSSRHLPTDILPTGEKFFNLLQKTVNRCSKGYTENIYTSPRLRPLTGDMNFA